MKNPLLNSRTGNTQIDIARYRANLITILDFHGHEVFSPQHRMPHQELIALIKKIKAKAEQKGLENYWLKSKKMTVKEWLGSYTINMYRKMNCDPRNVKDIGFGILVGNKLEIAYLNDICHAAGCGCDSCWGRMLYAKKKISS
jgi:hypothetical protein